MTKDEKNPDEAVTGEEERPRRVVVDEIIGEKARFLVARMRPKATMADVLNINSWEASMGPWRLSHGDLKTVLEAVR